MLTICLYNLEQAGIIVSHPTGLIYFTLAGWRLPTRHQLEGLFIPLSNDLPEGEDESLKLHNQLNQAISGKSVFTSREADLIDDILLQVSSNDQISVDRQRITEALPGWLPVQVLTGSEFSQLEGLTSAAGFLVWPLKPAINP